MAEKPKTRKGATKSSKSSAGERTRRKRVGQVITAGVVHILATFNNTIITITDTMGNTLGFGSAGASGFKGAKKSTPFAAQTAANKAALAVKQLYNQLSCVDVLVKGPGPGKEGAMRALAPHFTIRSLADVTGIPHNGCRAQKERRV